MNREITRKGAIFIVEDGMDEDAVNIWLSNVEEYNAGFFVSSGHCPEDAINDAIVLLEHTIEQLKSMKNKETQ